MTLVALDRDAVARRLLGGERQQVDLLGALRRADRVEPARQQDLPDQLVELVDVGLELRAPRRIGRRDIASAMLMRVSGVRSSCDALASSILCERTSSSMRLAERLKLRASAATSSLPSTFTRAARSPSPSWSTPALSRSSRRVSRRVDRPGADRDRDRDDEQRGQRPAAGPPRAARRAGHQEAAVAQGQQPGVAAAAQPHRRGAVELEPRQRPPRGREQRAVARIEREVDAQAPVQAFDHRLLPLGRRVGRRQRMHRQLARDVEHLVEARLVEGVARKPADRDHHDQQDRDDRDVDLEVESFHAQILRFAHDLFRKPLPLFGIMRGPALARRRNPRRAP